MNDNVRKDLDRFNPFAGYFARELAETDVTAVKVSVLPTSHGMIDAKRSGEVDLYFDSHLVAAHVARSTDARPLLRRWKRGVGTYRSLIIVPVDSPPRTMNDLAGHKIGFHDPVSTKASSCRSV